ncbi:MAG TPA: hypothetical protein VMF66_17635 [Candidatus Acidoferrum sp.]|nr:hypothetical protein [Candidatus Acidoferrum sp.]
MDSRVSILTGELQTLQKNLNFTTSPEAHTALLAEIRSKLKELDELVKHRLETVYGLGANPNSHDAQPDSHYDIFEQMPDGGVRWRGIVSRAEDAVEKLRELAEGTPNELFVCNLRTKTTIARMNSPANDEQRASESRNDNR